MDTIGFLSLTIDELRDLIYRTVGDALDANKKNSPPPPAEPAGNELLTRKEAAELLHVSVLTLSNWERRNILHPRRISRRVLYMKADVLAALARAGRPR
ncbi:MAG: DNA-binding protein [Chlorobi bacterium]|nr:DNA-binding protein [Chlorobiota bacterium]